MFSALRLRPTDHRHTFSLSHIAHERWKCFGAVTFAVPRAAVQPRLRRSRGRAAKQTARGQALDLPCRKPLCTSFATYLDACKGHSSKTAAADMRTRCNVVSQMFATTSGGEPSESDLTGLGVFPGQASTFKLCAATWSNPMCLAPVRSPLPEPRRLWLAFRVGASRTRPIRSSSSMSTCVELSKSAERGSATGARAARVPRRAHGDGVPAAVSV
ncbi:uncharacterized protein LOC127594097 [Hippocampus zosterae]|uniref:uncharacterized protein LOC127594097 n=1 Tax=Hippocampus zosterae TaxID=109293 RepID=UPI00223E6B3D|nr:uncharacterized protein LOC127594097 [Hippocampus zosterae]